MFYRRLLFLNRATEMNLYQIKQKYVHVKSISVITLINNNGLVTRRCSLSTVFFGWSSMKYLKSNISNELTSKKYLKL